jgi:hypothetical protein
MADSQDVHIVYIVIYVAFTVLLTILPIEEMHFTYINI